MGTVNVEIGAEKYVNAEKTLDKLFTNSFSVDADHCVSTVIPGSASDAEILLFDSSLIVNLSFLILKTSGDIEIKKNSAGNEAQKVASYYLSTDEDVLKLYVTVPGTDDVTIELVYGGVTA